MGFFKSKSEKAYYKLCKQCLLESNNLTDEMVINAKESWVPGANNIFRVDEHNLTENEYKAYVFLEFLVENLRDSEKRKIYDCDKFINACRENVIDLEILEGTIKKYFPTVDVRKISRTFFKLNIRLNEEDIRSKQLF